MICESAKPLKQCVCCLHLKYLNVYWFSIVSLVRRLYTYIIPKVLKSPGPFLLQSVKRAAPRNTSTWPDSVCVFNTGAGTGLGTWQNSVTLRGCSFQLQVLVIKHDQTHLYTSHSNTNQGAQHFPVVTYDCNIWDAAVPVWMPWSLQVVGLLAGFTSLLHVKCRGCSKYLIRMENDGNYSSDLFYWGKNPTMTGCRPCCHWTTALWAARIEPTAPRMSRDRCWRWLWIPTPWESAVDILGSNSKADRWPYSATFCRIDILFPRGLKRISPAMMSLYTSSIPRSQIILKHSWHGAACPAGLYPERNEQSQVDNVDIRVLRAVLGVGATFPRCSR